MFQAKGHIVDLEGNMGEGTGEVGQYFLDVLVQPLVADHVPLCVEMEELLLGGVWFFQKQSLTVVYIGYVVQDVQLFLAHVLS
jgi:hypothetical protein